MKERVLLVSCAVASLGLAISLYCGQGKLGGVKWAHLSSKNGELPAPNPGTEQTASLVLDVDKDGVNDFVITERTAAPAVVWYRRGKNGWTSG
ncbi:MAG: hypothetical protein MUP80_03550 [Acidobacteriia bacterium]|nr:hypothetical protein [Terriglobia bacterium]